mgnify:CR=1 FL=1
MLAVVRAQFQKDRRNPILVLLFIAGSILATLIFAGGVNAPVTIVVFSEEENAAAVEEKWLALLNQDTSLQFVSADPEQAKADVKHGKADIAVRLLETDYRMVKTIDLPTTGYVEQHVATVFQREVQISALVQAEGKEEIRADIAEYMATPPFQLERQGLDTIEPLRFNMSTQLLFAFTFFVAMFIIGFKVNNVTNDKTSGVWNRMILSPISKTNMYSGYIVYTFFLAMFQIIVVLLLFKYVMRYELGDQFGLLIVIAACFAFGMISVAMLVTGFVRTPEQFYSIYPSLIPLIPLVSGAYMMPGTIKNPVLLFIADLFPLAHAMDAISQVIFQQAGFRDIVQPSLIMLIIGVVAMGIGINLIERRSQ